MRAGAREEPRDRIYFSPFGDQRYGIVMENPMRYGWLPIEAKGMYAYLCVVCAASSYAPTVMRQCEELGIGVKRYYKFRGMLEEAGLVRVEKGKREGSPWKFNKYILNADVSPAALFRHSPNPEAEPPVDGEVVVENNGTAIVENSNPQVKEVGQFDHIPSIEIIDDCGKPEIVENPSAKPQVKVVGQFGHVRFDQTISKDIEPTNSTSTSLEGRGPVENPQPPADDADVLAAFDSMLDATANRNSIRNPVSRAATLGRFRSLVEGRRLDLGAVGAAWARHQERRRAVVSGDEYMPNLARWLSDDSPEGALEETLALQARENGPEEEKHRAASFADAVFSDREIGSLFFAAQDARRTGDEGLARDLEADARRLFEEGGRP